MQIIKKFFIIVFTLVLSYYTAPVSIEIYEFLFNMEGGFFFMDFSIIAGIPLSYIFFLVLLFTVFGEKYKYLWMSILLIPAVIFEVYFDLLHIYFPIILGLIGWFLGWLILMIWKKVRG